MRRRRAALLILALGAAAAFAACREEKSASPPRAPRFDEIEYVTPSPTPVPLLGGTWKVGVSGTGARCGLAAPAELAWLDGRARAWQLASEPSLLDAHGAWDGTSLTLTAGARRSWRPEVDCVVGEEEIWALSRAAATAGAPADGASAPAGTVGTLEGTVSFARFHIDGAECAGVAPGLPDALVDTNGAGGPSVVFAPATGLRAEPKQAAAVIDHLNRGEIVTVSADPSPWARVRAGARDAWVNDRDLLPTCVDRHAVRLTWSSPAPAPKVDDAEARPEAGDVRRDATGARPPAPAFSPFALDPAAEPTSAPDLFAKEAPRPVATAAAEPTATPRAPKTKSKGKGKHR
ncbi:MAG TPA: SH3 domain-containing protein [bacterium]|nr:SH3 domain-containing protein [bacterium]